MCQITLVVILVLVSGLIGGIGNFFKLNESWDIGRFGLWKSLVIGIIASASVPLFLNMLSSNLMDFTNSPTDYFVFVGFCLVAFFFSGRFMDSIGDKVVKELEEVKKKTEVIEEKTQDNSEIMSVLVDDNIYNIDSKSKMEVNLTDVWKSGKEEEVKKVLDALNHKIFRFRSVQGISADSGLSKNDVEDILEKLQKANIVRRYNKNDGNLIFTLI